MPRHSRYAETVWTGVIHATVLPSWGTTAIRSRSFLASAMTSRPSMVALPELGSSSVESILARVVLPAPFLPMTAKMPWAGMVKSTDG